MLFIIYITSTTLAKLMQLGFIIMMPFEDSEPVGPAPLSGSGSGRNSS
jgi:hypothetical protein